MIKLILFLATLEAKLKDKKYVEKSFDELQKERIKRAKYAPSPTTGGKLKAGFYNIGKIAKNAYDSTVGNITSMSQNRKTEKYFTAHPKSHKRIRYLKPGVFQPRGAQAPLGKQILKSGDFPIHLKGNHHLKREENVERTIDDIEGVQKRTKLYKPSERNDSYRGHSSGADVGIYMAGDKRTKKLGIKQVQAVAPAPGGVEAKTLGQRLLIPLVSEDNLKGYIGRKNAVELNKRKPVVPVHVISGKYDNLVPPSQATYKHAKKHYVINDIDSTHFGTAGGNKKMNQISIDLMKKHDKKYHKKAA